MLLRFLTLLLLLCQSALICAQAAAPAFNFTLKQGPIRSPQVNWRGLIATDVEAFAQSEEGLLLIRKAKGKMYGGELRGDFRIGAKGTDFKLVFSKIDIAKLPQEITILSNKYSGNIDGELTFSSTRIEPQPESGRKFNVEGEGEFELLGGDLGTLGLVVAIQDILDLPLNKKRRITDARIKFNIENSSLLFRSIELIGKDVEMIGRGRIYYDGRMDLRFRIKAKNKLLKIVPVLGTVLSEVLSSTGALLPIWVQGTVGKPTVSVVQAKDKNRPLEPRKDRQ